MAAAGPAGPAPCLKAQLREDPSLRAYGAFLMSGSPLVAELMALAGYDFLVVDMEHSPIDVHGALPMIQAVAAAGKPALLRVPLNRPELIKKALDLGPAGIVVPLVDSEEDARAVAAACKYPRGGVRGVAPALVRASGWGLDATYARTAEERCLVLCQVETAAAVEACGAILSVEGVDGIFVGPLDLSAALGHLHDPGHAQVLEALSRVEATARNHPSKVLAGFAGARKPAVLFEAGYRLVAGAADVALLRSAAARDVLEVATAAAAVVVQASADDSAGGGPPSAKRLRG